MAVNVLRMSVNETSNVIQRKHELHCFSNINRELPWKQIFFFLHMSAWEGISNGGSPNQR